MRMVGPRRSNRWPGRIDDEGITYVYFQFVSVTGRVMGKGIPAAHWASVADEGLPAGLRRDGQSLHRPARATTSATGPKPSELVGCPTSTPFACCPGTPRWPASSAPCSEAGRRSIDPGAFLTSDCRGNLHRIHEQFTGDTGLTLQVGCEPEMMWLKTNPDGTPSVEGKTKPYCYHIDQFSELQPVIHRVIEYCARWAST